MTTESKTRNSPASIVEVHYGEYRLIPAPLIQWTEESEHDPDTKGRTVQRTRLKLDGTFIILPTGTYEGMFEMQKALRKAFSVDGREFRILAGAGNTTLPSGAPIVSGMFPLVTNVDIEADLQHNRVDYTVDLEVEAASTSGQAFESLTDTWDLTENPDGLYLDVVHNVSARGINTLASGTNAVHNAINAVYPLLGVDKMPYYLPYYTEPNASGGGTVQMYHVAVNRTEQIDTRGGNYSVTESFILASGTDPYVHSVNSSFDEDEDGIATVKVNGKIQGLGRSNFNGDNGGIAFDRALNGFSTDIQPNLPSTASGVYLRYKSGTLYTTNHLGFSISENRTRGTINYSISYNDDPAENLPSGIVEATSSVQRTDGIRLYGSHPIPFRRLGNVVQDIKTTTEGQMVITASAKAENTGDATADTNRAILHVQDEINRLKPNSADFQTLRPGAMTENHSDKELTAQASVTYIFTIDLASVFEVDSDIALHTL